MCNKKTRTCNRKSATQGFLWDIVSTHLQRLKLHLKLHLPCWKSLSKESILCRYPSRNFWMDFGRATFKNIFHQSSIQQHKLSIYHYGIIFNWTSWLLNESNENFWNDYSLLWSFDEYLYEIAFGLVKFRKLSREQFCKLWQIWKWLGIDCYKVYDISWKFRFRTLKSAVQKKRIGIWFWFLKHLWRSFFS